MPLAALLQIVQILSAAGSAALDVTKIVEAVRKRGGTTLTDEETAHVRSIVGVHAQALSAYGEMTALEESSGA